jgi:hypothetical protein
VGGAVPGWAPVDQDQLRDPARRPIPEIVREVFSVYGRHLEPILVLTAVIEGSLTLISLPYIVVTVQIILAGLQSMSEMFRSPLSGQTFRAMADIFERFRDPVLGAYTGIVSVAPLASAILLSSALGAYLMSNEPADRTASGALRAILRRWAPLLLPIVALAAILAVFTVWSYGLSASMFERPLFSTDLSDLWLSFALSIVAPVVIGVAFYLVVRWVVVAPALVVEKIGLRAALARSAALTRRRRIHVGICLLVVGTIWSLLGWLVIAPALLIAGVIESAGGGPLLAIPLAVYVIGRIVLAPLLPILIAILYRDMKEAGPAAEPDTRNDASAPPGWGSLS